jgi:hypothetical protein
MPEVSVPIAHWCSEGARCAPFHTHLSVFDEVSQQAGGGLTSGKNSGTDVRIPAKANADSGNPGTDRPFFYSLGEREVE